mgnify:CR=1 FL=1
MWYIVGAIIIIALAFWYFSAKSPVEVTPQTPNENTAAAISAEFNQIPDISAELDQAASTSAQAVQAF